ncbi:hypothetical protein MalM25_32690 [Planctomycetes bacterium MalM25]|nr:hypothetical protein MalM25_32690 [Planctomycetes bacterium MalM25]
MNAKKKWAIAGGTLLALLAGVWVGLFGLFDDPALAELQREFDASIARGDGPPPRDQMRERLDGLSDQQRRRFFMRNRETMMQEMSGRMTEVLNLPPEERRREIAARADRVMEARANGDADNRPPGPPGGGRPGGPGGRDRGDMSQSDRMKSIADRTTPEMRGAFSETKRLIDEELANRGQDPMEPREMREVMRGSRS